MPRDIEQDLPQFDEIDYAEISQFFTRTGAVELISLLDNAGYRFDEIDEELDVSRAVLNERRAEAYGLGLIRPAQTLQDGKVRRVHTLTTIGSQIKRKMRAIGLVQTHERLRGIRKEYGKQKEEFRDWVDDPGELQHDVEESLKGSAPPELFEDDDEKE